MKTAKTISKLFILIAISLAQTGVLFSQINLSYPIVDNDQEVFYDSLVEIAEPSPGEAFYGQDASYTGNIPSYQDNNDGTVNDLVTGLMWTKDDSGEGMFWEDALSYAEN